MSLDDYVDTLPDTEEAVRAWIDADGLPAFFGIPDDAPDLFGVVSRTGGFTSEGGVDNADVTVQVWGRTKHAASAAARRIVERLWALEGEHLDEQTIGYGSPAASMLWQPAADTGRPRYIVTTTVVTRAA